MLRSAATLPRTGRQPISPGKLPQMPPTKAPRAKAFAPPPGTNIHASPNAPISPNSSSQSRAVSRGLMPIDCLMKDDFMPSSCARFVKKSKPGGDDRPGPRALCAFHHQRQDVVAGHQFVALVGDLYVPCHHALAHAFVVGAVAVDLTLAGQARADSVADCDWRDEAQVVEAIVGQHWTRRR